MTELLSSIQNVINQDILIGFGYYSVLFYIVKLNIKDKKKLVEFDQNVTKTIVYAGLFSFLLFLISTLIYYLLSEGEDHFSFVNRLTGNFWFSYWLQGIIWLFITQLLRIKRLAKSIAYRLTITLLFIFTLERVVIIITSFHRDYLPSSWSVFPVEISFIEIIIGVLFKILSVLIITGLYILLKKKVTPLKSP